MARMKDRTGDRYGRLVVIGLDEKRGRKFFWRCQCDCGRKAVVVGDNLSSGHTKSCGCLRFASKSAAF